MAECAVGKFCPDDPVTRAAAAVAIAKGAGIAPLSPAVPTFTDVPASHAAFGYVEAFAAACVTSGCGANQFCPDTEMVRAQTAVFVARAFDVGGANPCAKDAGLDAAPGDSGSDSAPSDSGADGQWSDSGLPQLDGGGGLDAGGTAGKGGSATKGADDGGCGCALPGRRGISPLIALIALGWAFRRWCRQRRWA